MTDHTEVNVSDKNETASELVAKYQSLCDKVSADGYKPTVGDRKNLQSLFSEFQSVTSNDATTLETVGKLQSLLTKCQQIIR